MKILLNYKKIIMRQSKNYNKNQMMRLKEKKMNNVRKIN